MQYFKYSKVYGDGSASTCWIVGGKYKIVRYDYRYSGGYTEKRETFHAFYKPSFFANWGNHIAKPHYDTLTDAVKACHAFDTSRGSEATFGGSI